MKRLAVVLAAMMAAGCATGREPGLPTRPRRLPLEVEIDTKGIPLGAYQIVILSQPADARIVAIESPRGAEFAGQPHFLPWTFESGSTRITGYSPHQSPPRRPYRLLAVTFEQVGSSRAAPSVRVERLYDTSTPPREITAYEVHQSRDVLDFERPD